VPSWQHGWLSGGITSTLVEVSRIRPQLAAFFGCLDYAALRPEEAVTLRLDDLILPAYGRGP